VSRENDVNKITVVEYSERWANGGLEKYIVNLIRFLDKTKFDIKIIVAQKETDLYDKDLALHGVRVENLLKTIYANPVERILRNQELFYEYLKRNKCDVLHLHINQGVVMRYAKVAKKLGISKVIIHCHNAGMGNKNILLKVIGHNLGKRIYRKYADRLIACSDLAEKWLYTEADIRKGKIEIYPCIVDVEKYKFSDGVRQEMRQAYELQDKYIYLHIGRMNAQKNQFFLLDICKYLFEIDCTAMMVLIGTGELSEKIHQYAEKLNIEKKIIFIERTSCVWKYMNMADAFLLPSKYEGNPIVGIEAQACGLPCFFSESITKQAEILETTKYISLDRTAGDWAKIIVENRMKVTAKLRKESNRAVIQHGYDIQKQILSIESLYSK